MGVAARACHNKGFARRPQEFLGLGAGRRSGSWEEEGRYGGMTKVGKEWVCSGVGVAARACHNKGFARRPQEFLAWEVGGVRYVGMEV